MNKPSDTTKSSISPLSLVFSFSIVSIYIALNPTIFGNQVIMYTVLIFSLLMSIGGLIIEAQKFIQANFKDNPINFNNFPAGLFFLLLFFLAHNYLFSKYWQISILIDFLKVVLLLIASSAILDGIINISKSIKNGYKDTESFVTTLSKSASFLLALVSFIASIVAILDSFGIIG